MKKHFYTINSLFIVSIANIVFFEVYWSVSRHYTVTMKEFLIIGLPFLIFFFFSSAVNVYCLVEKKIKHSLVWPFIILNLIVAFHVFKILVLKQ